jgi:hypothetical protein
MRTWTKVASTIQRCERSTWNIDFFLGTLLRIGVVADPITVHLLCVIIIASSSDFHCRKVLGGNVAAVCQLAVVGDTLE